MVGLSTRLKLDFCLGAAFSREAGEPCCFFCLIPAYAALLGCCFGGRVEGVFLLPLGVDGRDNRMPWKQQLRPRCQVLFPHVGFIVTNLETPSRAAVRFYNKGGTAEQWIKEGQAEQSWL
jgi:hypothetical protein